MLGQGKNEVAAQRKSLLVANALRPYKPGTWPAGCVRLAKVLRYWLSQRTTSLAQ